MPLAIFGARISAIVKASLGKKIVGWAILAAVVFSSNACIVGRDPPADDMRPTRPNIDFSTSWDFGGVDKGPPPTFDFGGGCKPVEIEAEDGAHVRSPGWAVYKSSDLHQGVGMVSSDTARNETMTVKFFGRGITLFLTYWQGGGKISLAVDGKQVADVNTDSNEVKTQVPFVVAKGLTLSQHELLVVDISPTGSVAELDYFLITCE